MCELGFLIIGLQVLIFIFGFGFFILDTNIWNTKYCTHEILQTGKV